MKNEKGEATSNYIEVTEIPEEEPAKKKKKKTVSTLVFFANSK